MADITLLKRWQKWVGLDRFLALFMLIGLAVCVTSLLRGILLDRQVQVEYLSNGNEENGGKESSIFVDIEGAVINPGVYEMKNGSRLKDVLVIAGGLSSKADRAYCDRNLNLAELVKDGQKVYIPSSDTDAGVGYIEANSKSKMININTASLAELDTLWGVGESRAESIVKNRPYQKIEDLVSKGVLSKAVFEKNIEVISLF